VFHLPEIHGIIERRLLVNFHADPQIVQKILPPPFRPQIVKERAVVGICLIRFSDLRSPWIPKIMGLKSENAAHRFAVEWDSPHGLKQGVYIPRRDTSLWLATLVGGRVFPGVHHRADFVTEEKDDAFSVAYKSRSDQTTVSVEGNVGNFPEHSLFSDLSEASLFFEKGCVGYSPGLNHESYQGLELRVREWVVESLVTSKVESSFFSNERLFPKNSIEYDHTLLMRNIVHSWHTKDEIVYRRHGGS
jgi:hypothetical protein